MGQPRKDLMGVELCLQKFEGHLFTEFPRVVRGVGAPKQACRVGRIRGGGGGARPPFLAIH